MFHDLSKLCRFVGHSARKFVAFFSILFKVVEFYTGRPFEPDGLPTTKADRLDHHLFAPTLFYAWVAIQGSAAPGPI